MHLAEKKDSFGICFIEGNDYRVFLEKEEIISRSGNFVGARGEILGKHNGIYNYSIEQRRGLGLNLNFPVNVSEIRLDSNEIVSGKFDDLKCSKVTINKYQYPDKEDIMMNVVCHVKMPYRLQLTPCKINILDEQRVEVELLNSEAMIANGQAVIFSDGQRLRGEGLSNRQNRLKCRPVFIICFK